MKHSRFSQAISRSDTKKHMGRVDKVIGMTIESTGPEAKIGDVCNIYPSYRAAGKGIQAEVVGFREEKVLLMPYEDLSGIGPGSIVESTGEVLKIPVGDQLIGRVLDGLGRPMDEIEGLKDMEHCPVHNIPSNPLKRPMIDTKISVGVKAIDGLLTLGKGQRMGIFSGSGVGKSTLLGMVARNIEADINVIGLVGERGREVREFIERDLKEEGMAKSILVVATSDQSSMSRLKCAMVATTIAEYYKDRGKDVLLMMDSLTRFAMAQREVGLAIGEPPVARGYTPSIYTLMPKLLERSGNFENGSITGIYTVLVEGDDVNEPISDTVRGIIDGHIVLSRAIAMRNHYPAIDVLASISRLMTEVVSPEHMKLAGELRKILSIYNQNFDLISIGAYKHGTNAEIDDAIRKIERVNGFLTQGINDRFDYDTALSLMKEVFAAH